MSENIKKIVLLGPQGSGKSTQSKLIADFLGIQIIGASQLLREVIAKGTDLGNKIKTYMDKGVLIPDEHMINLILGDLQSPHCLNGFLLDGFPRNLNQAKSLDNTCGVDKVFDIEISDSEAIKRLSGRRVCDNNHVFHLEFQPSSKGDICDICGEELYQREDDKEVILANRLKIYRQETSKLIDYYKNQNKLVIFNGEQSIEKVGDDILVYLKKNVG